MSAASWSGFFRRGTIAQREGARRRAAPSATSGGTRGRDPARGTRPTPRRRTGSRGRAASRRSDPRTCARPAMGSARAGAPRTRAPAAATNPTRRARPAAQRGARVGRPERDHEQRARTSPARREPTKGAARRGRPREPEAQDQERREDRVVRVRARHVLRERVGGPGERERRAEARPAEAPAPRARGRRARAGRRAIAVACAAGRSSHFPVHPKSEVARHVRDVGDGAVVSPARSPTRSGRWSGSLADVAVRVRRPPPSVPLGRHVAVRHLAWDDPLAPITPA